MATSDSAAARPLTCSLLLSTKDDFSMAKETLRVAKTITDFIENLVPEELTQCGIVRPKGAELPPVLISLDDCVLEQDRKEHNAVTERGCRDALLAAGVSRRLFTISDVVLDQSEHLFMKPPRRVRNFAEVFEHTADSTIIAEDSKRHRNWLRLGYDQLAVEVVNQLSLLENHVANGRSERVTDTVMRTYFADGCCPESLVFLRRMLLGCCQSASHDLVYYRMKRETHLYEEAVRKNETAIPSLPVESELEHRFRLTEMARVVNTMCDTLECWVQQVSSAFIAPHDVEHCDTCTPPRPTSRFTMTSSFVSGFSQHVDPEDDESVRAPVLHLADFVVYGSEHAPAFDYRSAAKLQHENDVADAQRRRGAAALKPIATIVRPMGPSYPPPSSAKQQQAIEAATEALTINLVDADM